MKKFLLFTSFTILLSIFSNSFAVMQPTSTYDSVTDFLAAEGGICKTATDGCNTIGIIDGQLGPSTMMACLDEKGNDKAQIWSCKEYDENIMFMTGRPTVGNDADEHGCIGSAGYQWNEAQESCLRIFEQGLSDNDQNFYITIKQRLTQVQNFQVDRLFHTYQHLLDTYDMQKKSEINAKVIQRLDVKISSFLLQFPQDTGLSYRNNMIYFKLLALKFEMQIWQHALENNGEY